MPIRYHPVLFLVSLIFLASLQLNAQGKRLRFQYLTTENGLSHNMVDCMLMDSKGFMWFGTWNGLNRFDGYQFTVFKNDSRNITLSGNFIYDLAEDNYGNIWIGTENGLNVFLSNKEFFRNYTAEGRSAGHFVSDRVQALFFDRRGYLWVGTDRGLDCLLIGENGDIKESRHYHHEDSSDIIKDQSITAIFQDREENMWIGTNNGLFKFDSSHGRIMRYQAASSSAIILSSGVINTIYQDRQGILWVGTLNGLNRINPSTNNTTLFFHEPENPGSLIHNTVMAVAEDIRGNLMVGTLGGLSILNEKKGSFTNYVSDINSSFGLNNDFVNCLLSTSDGNVWIGTERGGINKLYVYQNSFEFFESELGNLNSLSHNTVNSILEDNRFIWIGTAGGGLNRFDKERKKFTHYRYNPNLGSGLASDFISALYVDRKGNLWIGTWGGGLHLVTPGRGGQGQFILYQNDQNDTASLINDFVAFITEDRNGNLWIGTSGGIDRFIPGGRGFEHFSSGYLGRYVDRVGCLLFDKHNNLWVGSEYGLYRIKASTSGIIDMRESAIDYFTHIPVETESISGDYVISMISDIHGNLWLGTYGSGLNMISSERLLDSIPPFTNYTLEDGLCNNIIFGIQEDTKGNLWLSTDNGLSRFKVSTGKFENFYTEDGLLSNQFYWAASHKNNAGKLYFGGMKGLIAFYPDSLIDHQPPTNTLITDLKIFNESVEVDQEYFSRVILSTSIVNTKQLVFSYRIKEFSFEFTTLNYIQPEKILYAYKMLGFDDNWSYVDSKRRFVSYTNLRGGNYTFMVMSSQDGNWDHEPVRMEITIIPPFWEQSWFRITLVLFLTALIILYTRYRTYSLKKQKQKLETLVNERTIKIEEQKVELLAQAESLKESNLQLEKRQDEIEGQKKRLELQNSQILNQRDKLVDLNKKIHQVHQQQLDLFTYISHEFRSPLTLIITPLEQLEKEITDRNPVKDKIHTVHRNARRLLHLVNQLMDLRRVDTGKLELKTSRDDIVKYLFGISESFTELASAKKIKFCVSTVAPSLEIFFDKDIVENIVYNLLSNAFKYTHEKGTVQLLLDIVTDEEIHESDVKVVDRTYYKHQGIDSYVKISISDTGPGINPDDYRNIFRRFYRLNTSYTHKVYGSGIGLFLTREMVKVHKGLLFMRSVPGEGSTFSVYLPMGQDHLEPEEIITHKQPGNDLPLSSRKKTLVNLERGREFTVNREAVKTNQKKPRILLVDDDPELTEYLRTSLNRTFQILTAENGREGLKKAIESSPELIVSDIMMPGMDGLEFCSLVKNDLNTSHIPLILLTARAEVEHYLEGYECGADDYIAKPFNIALLEAKIKSLIVNRNRLRNLFSHSIVPVPRELTTTVADENFLRKTLAIMEENLSDPEFGVQKLAEQLCVSRSLLHKKLTAIADLSANDFITSVRLKKSVMLLIEGKMNISEVAFSVGFNDPKYFSRCFKRQFGRSPKQYALSLT